MKPLPEKFSGDHPIVSKLNLLLENLMERTPKDGTNCKFDKKPDGFFANPKVTLESDGGFFERFRFVKQYKDYTVCNRWTANLSSDARGIVGASETALVRIAKPDEVKTSNWDNIARGGAGIGSVNGYRYDHHEPDGSTRTATLLDASEFGAATIGSEQEIFPPYIAGESLILAMKVKQGSLMRITEEDGQAVNFTVDYIELPGRKFENKPGKIRVCIEGSSGPWFALFRPSGAFREE